MQQWNSRYELHGTMRQYDAALAKTRHDVTTHGVQGKAKEESKKERKMQNYEIHSVVKSHASVR